MARNLDIDNIQRNLNTKIILATPTGGVYAFLVQDTFKINGEAVYESLFGQAVASKIPGYDYIKKFAGVTIKNRNETTLSWVQSKKPQFTLELLFLALKSGDDPRVNVVRLLEGVFPIKGNAFVMQPPWKYDIKKSGNTTDVKSTGGKIAVKIGKWFLATNQVLTNVDFDISTQVTDNGYPLYCTGSISFEPDKDIFASEVASFFLGVNSVSLGGV